MEQMRHISTFLDESFPAEGSEQLSVGDIISAMHERGFGLMIILLCLPIAIPGCPPPIPSIFALPVCFLCMQMVLRRNAPSLPAFIERKAVKRAGLRQTINRTLPYIRKIETIIRPRLPWLTNSHMERYVGAVMLVFSLTILIPLPLTNTVPGIAMIIISIGLLSRDGLLMLGGMALGAAWLVVLVVLSDTVLKAVT